MVATVRLNSELEAILNDLSKKFHKKKSDVIREAISFYAESLEKEKKSRIQKAIAKTAVRDFKVYKELEDTLDEGL